ncbi:MAG: MFS transporter [Calditrichaceae bacterium]
MIPNPKEEQKKYRHNFFSFLWHGVFLHISAAFTQITTVQTAFIYTLTGSSFLAGLLLSANRIGSIAPQLFFINWVERSKYKKYFLIAAVVIRGISLISVAAIIYLISQPEGRLGVLIIFGILLFFFMAGGMGDVSYYTVLSKTVDPRKRGKLFGLRYMIGGIFGLGAGYLTNRIFEHFTDFPVNYAILYALSGFILLIGVAGFASIKEAPDAAKKNQPRWYQHFQMIRHNPNFVKFITVEILLSTSHIALPLYVIYAGNVLKMPLELIGIFVTAQIAGEIVSGPLWGKLGDKINFRIVLFFIGIASTLIPAAAIFLPLIHPSLYIIVFFLIGMTFQGLTIGISNYLLEIAPKDSVPSFVAIKNFLQLPTILFPVLGGILVNYISYQWIFAAVGVMLLSGTLLSSNLYCIRSEFKERLSFMQIFD